jgi:hypothetical protein
MENMVRGVSSSGAENYVFIPHVWICFRLFDVSKQVVGQMFVHGVNVLISDVGSHHSAGNACVYYFLNILIDTTLGEHVFQLQPNWC